MSWFWGFSLAQLILIVLGTTQYALSKPAHPPKKSKKTEKNVQWVTAISALTRVYLLTLEIAKSPLKMMRAMKQNLRSM